MSDQEREALLKVLAGISAALDILPDESGWTGALRDARTLLTAQTTRP